MAGRAWVRVSARIEASGQVTPLSFALDGVTVPVDRVVERRLAQATKGGGQGMRYTIRVGQAQAQLFQDDMQRWFLEEDEHVREIPRHDGG
ncbi:MAG TPA: hypothetical protein VLA21_10610 [Candidatus Limnocylindria bacterium]|nr:hypothetical protein [Candidatus Limnocylindria bacterium]